MKKREFAKNKLSKAALLGMTAGLFVSAEPVVAAQNPQMNQQSSEQAAGRTRRYNPQQQVASKQGEKDKGSCSGGEMDGDESDSGDDKMSCGGPGGCGGK